jgi:ABC-type transport system involved in multi-copper enzyme maturation permease subunit
MKTRTRWLPYMLLAFLFIGAAIQIWLFGGVAYLDERNNIEEYGTPAGAFTFRWPYAILPLLDSGQYWGPVFIAFFAASAVATDFGWGSVRLSIARGVTRTQFLAAKLLTTALICTAGMLLALAVGVVFSLGATQLFEDPTKYVGINPEPSLSGMPLMIARTALTIVPYGMLAFMLAVLSRSTALGATGVLVYKLVESASVSLLGELGGSWAWGQNLFLEHHASGLLAVNRSGYPDYNTIAFRAIPDPADAPDPWFATSMLVAFCIVFGAVSFASFARRDLNSRE